jgi:hypothetical protein
MAIQFKLEKRDIPVLLIFIFLLILLILTFLK